MELLSTSEISREGSLKKSYVPCLRNLETSLKLILFKTHSQGSVEDSHLRSLNRQILQTEQLRNLTALNSREEISPLNSPEEKKAVHQHQEDTWEETREAEMRGKEEDQEVSEAEDQEADLVDAEAREEGQDPETEVTVMVEVTETKREIEEIVTEIEKEVTRTASTIEMAESLVMRIKIPAEEETGLDPKVAAIEDTETKR